MVLEIVQVDFDSKTQKFVVINNFNSVKEIVGSFNKDVEGGEKRAQRTSFDQALKKKIKSAGFWWMPKAKWEQGERPSLEKQSRNKIIYAYKIDSKNPAKKVFIDRYKNAVKCADELKLSVSNVRRVANPEDIKQDLKGYYFSYEPIFEVDDEIADEKAQSR